MNEKEKIIIELIRQDPFITQQDLAERLNVSRSAVAGYISSLTRQGMIKGRAYVMNEGPGILIIGGANMDRKITLTEKVNMGDSNPAATGNTRGGVARNIAENLVHMGMDPNLLTVLGQDQDSEHLRKHAAECGLDLSLSLTRSDQSTGSYTAIFNPDHDLILAAADMAIYDTVMPDEVRKSFRKAGHCEWVAVDTNFSLEAMREILTQTAASKGTKLAVIPVSASKLNRIPYRPEQINLLILNHFEAITLVKNWTGHVTEDEKELMHHLTEEGVEQVIITKGAEGAYYQERGSQMRHQPAPQTNVVDVTGAGDAFSSGVLFSLSHNNPLDEAVRTGLLAAKATLESTDTVTSTVNETWIKSIQQS
ncbi:PfkB family carbohydrate kinase [Salisediminibacterium beveridgei]|uniref:Putative sugar kinase yeiI n=1 Tax=Salisediminibacterium beveridgei TaxID=632773 RepID=A0A1D7QTT8_9BACI|nr:PfkB family carbohydrate kinase [Salisediminibacterium beveridgei]AOM82434.1 putative sugar kinase yeiI [Salisediminibacterium beveridgei]